MAPLQKPQLPLGERVRELRDGLTQEDLAYEVREKTGRRITPGAISQIERGAIRPERETMEALLTTLGVDPEEIPEYRLAKLREALDERAVGLENATALMEAIEDVLPAAKRRRHTPNDGLSRGLTRARQTRRGRRPRPESVPDQLTDTPAPVEPERRDATGNGR